MSIAEMNYGKQLSKLVKPLKEDMIKTQQNAAKSNIQGYTNSTVSKAYEYILNMFDTCATGRVDYANRLLSVMGMVKTSHESFKTDVKLVFIYLK